MEEILYEYRRSAIRRGSPKLVPKEQLRGEQGFRSLYGYTPEVTGLICERKGTFGLAGQTLFANDLIIDIDDNIEEVEQAKADLIRLGYTFSMYMSGSPDSAHFHLPCVPQLAEGLNSIHLQWVTEHIKGFDNIYKPSGIIRLIGTYHTKYPGERKREVFNFNGELLDLTDYSTRIQYKLPSFTAKEVVDRDKLESIFNQCLFTRDYSISRNGMIFKLACLAKDISYSLDETLEKLDIYNNIMVDPPLKGQEVMAVVRSVFRKD